MELKKLVIRPFLSTNALILIAVALTCVGQIATMLAVCAKISSPGQTEAFSFFYQFRDLITIALPLYLVALITDILRDKTKIRKALLMNLGLAILFYVIEIWVFYGVVKPFINGLINYYLERYPTGSEMISSIFSIVSTYAISFFSNMNVFLDLFVVTLFAFFLFYEPKAENKKLKILFKFLSLIPVLYFLTNFILLGLYKMGYFLLTIEQASFLLHRNYLCFIFFFGVIIYQKHRENIYYKFRKNDEISFEDYKKSKLGLYQYNFLIIIALLFLVLVDYLFSFIPNSSAFGIGNSYILLFSLPLLLFFNSERRVHVKTSFLIKFALYAFLGVVLVIGYISIFGFCLNYLDNILGILKP